jgi:hypothetical protein
MTNKRTGAALAARREALIIECALQRISAGREVMALMEPVNAPGGIRDYIGGNMKVPLAIAGVVLGMMVVRPRRALPIITAGLSLWKFARPLMAMLKKPSEVS